MAEAETGIQDFDALVRLYWPKVYRYALASLRDTEAAETVAQECFLRAHRALDRFRGECSPGAWLMQIAVNLVRDRVRNRRWQFWKRTKDQAIDITELAGRMAAHAPSAEAALSAREEVTAVWDAASRLPQQQRTVFLLRFVEDMDLLEIAAAMGLKEGTVKAHLFRALEAVRSELRRTK